ncbi:hypothetical protein OAB57_00790 [Bacteriovoracaceae bacterium]|nr:hypothetical protein [Bacteriovoracaceae bacterium]
MSKIGKIQTGILFILLSTLSSATAKRINNDELLRLSMELVTTDYEFAVYPVLENIGRRSRNTFTAKNIRKLDEILTILVEKNGAELLGTLVVKNKFLLISKTARLSKAAVVFKNGDIQSAVKLLKDWRGSGWIELQRLFLLGSARYVTGKYEKAKSAFEQCSSHFKRNYDQFSHIKDTIGRDKIGESCQAGIARSFYAKQNYNRTISKYFEISKKSYIWPEILFEEAWASFRAGDINRSLGKLVTFNSPLMEEYAHPETYVLRGISFFKLCLWEDVKKTVDSFYSKYGETYRSLRKQLSSDKIITKNINRSISQRRSVASIDRNVKNLVNSIMRNAKYQRMKKVEDRNISKVKEVREKAKRGSMSGRTANLLERNLKATLKKHRKLMVNYVQKQMERRYTQLSKAFEHVTTLKFLMYEKEIDRISGRTNELKKRGNKNNINRSQRQYFWIFNGEYWPDEMGDKVFALKSEC